jgi:phage shock protein A
MTKGGKSMLTIVLGLVVLMGWWLLHRQTQRLEQRLEDVSHSLTTIMLACPQIEATRKQYERRLEDEQHSALAEQERTRALVQLAKADLAAGRITDPDKARDLDEGIKKYEAWDTVARGLASAEDEHEPDK